MDQSELLNQISIEFYLNIDNSKEILLTKHNKYSTFEKIMNTNFISLVDYTNIEFFVIKIVKGFYLIPTKDNKSRSFQLMKPTFTKSA